MVVRRWPRCRAREAVGAAAAPSVLATSCDTSRTDGAAAVATITRPRRQDDWRMRLVVLFQLAPYWLPELEYRQNARVSTVFTYVYVNEMSNLQQPPLLLH